MFTCMSNCAAHPDFEELCRFQIGASKKVLISMLSGLLHGCNKNLHDPTLCERERPCRLRDNVNGESIHLLHKLLGVVYD